MWDAMDTDLSRIDVQLEAVLNRIADSGFGGAVDTNALDEFVELTERRIALTAPPEELVY
jgi:hypothetical protein